MKNPDEITDIYDLYLFWWYTYPSEKYESQMEALFPIYGKIIQMFQTTNQLCIEDCYIAWLL